MVNGLLFDYNSSSMRSPSLFTVTVIALEALQAILSHCETTK